MTLSEAAKNRYANGQFSTAILRVLEIVSAALLASIIVAFFVMHTTIAEMKITSAERTRLRDMQISQLEGRDREIMLRIESRLSEMTQTQLKMNECLVRHIENTSIHKAVK